MTHNGTYSGINRSLGRHQYKFPPVWDAQKVYIDAFRFFYKKYVPVISFSPRDNIIISRAMMTSAPPRFPFPCIFWK